MLVARMALSLHQLEEDALQLVLRAPQADHAVALLDERAADVLAHVGRRRDLQLARAVDLAARGHADHAVHRADGLDRVVDAALRPHADDDALRAAQPRRELLLGPRAHDGAVAEDQHAVTGLADL